MKADNLLMGLFLFVCNSYSTGTPAVLLAFKVNIQSANIWSVTTYHTDRSERNIQVSTNTILGHREHVIPKIHDSGGQRSVGDMEVEGVDRD